jgi:nicotinamide mononucleotide adenylyltransferase
MSGIKNLSDIYEKQGKDFIEKLFNKELTVTENLDGSSFSFEKDFIGDNISFYKKDQDNPITKVDRILMTYYEKPILYIESFPEDIKKEIPIGWRFGMSYFPNTKPIRIEYDTVPKNHLLLTHIIIRDEFGETTRTIKEKDELDRWADLLGVERAPIIFQGLLNQDQKISLMDFLSTPLADLRNKFQTDSFSKYLISLLNPNIIKTTLGKDLLGQIDSLVFRFEDNEKGEAVLAKVIDPIFYALSREKKTSKSSYFPSDVYSLCLIDIMNFILEKGVENFEAEGDESEVRYINFVFSVFKGFIAQEGERYIGVDFNKPEYLKSENFSLNKEFIDDKEVITDLEKEECYEDILQMILNSFRKFKRKPQGFFTEGLIEQYNKLVEDIASYINAKRQDKIDECLGIPSFIWFKKAANKFKINEEEDDEEISLIEKKEPKGYELILESSDQSVEDKKDDKKGDNEKVEDTSEFFSFDTFKKVISTNKEKKKIKILKEDVEKINLLIGKFQPFNNGHLKMCTRLMKENGLPVFLCVVHPDVDTSNKYPFSLDLIKKSIGSLTSEDQKIFKGYKIIKTNLLEDAINEISEEVNPVSICIGEQDFENMVLQRDWVRKKYDLNGGDIEIFKTPKWADNKEIREFLVNDDFQGFKGKVPKPISVLYNEFSREAREKGQDSNK